MSSDTESGAGAKVNQAPASRYSDGERDVIYALARFFLEVGHTARAELIFHGLLEANPRFTASELGMCYVFALGARWEELENQARSVLEREPKNPEALLFGIMSALSLGERTTAGSRLGEFGELIDSRVELDADELLIYRSQLVRYEEA